MRRGMGLENTRDALRDLFLGTFALFPLVWYLAFTGLLDPLAEERAYCLGDMLMKVLILGVGFVQFESSWTHSSEAPGFQPFCCKRPVSSTLGTLRVISWFQSLLSQIQLVPLHLGNVAVENVFETREVGGRTRCVQLTHGVTALVSTLAPET